MNDETPPSALADADSLRVREYLAEALRLDLVGPGAGHELAVERLPGWVRPSNWYLTGFLVPSDAPPEQRSDADEDDPLGETPTVAGLSEESTEERTAAKKGFFPSSIGLSFLVPDTAEDLTVTVRRVDYSKAEHEGPDGDTVPVWQREPQERTMSVALSKAVIDHPVPQSGGLRLHIAVRPVDTARLAGLDEGTRSVSVFPVNNRSSVAGRPDDPESGGDVEQSYVFQAELEVEGSVPFVPRPDLCPAFCRRRHGAALPARRRLPRLRPDRRDLLRDAQRLPRQSAGRAGARSARRRLLRCAVSV